MSPNNPSKLTDEARRQLEEATRFHQERTARITREFDSWWSSTRRVCAVLAYEACQKARGDLHLFECGLRDAFAAGMDAAQQPKADRNNPRPPVREMLRDVWHSVGADFEAAATWFAQATDKNFSVRNAHNHLVKNGDVADRAFLETISREAFVAGIKHAKSNS